MTHHPEGRTVPQRREPVGARRPGRHLLARAGVILSLGVVPGLPLMLAGCADDPPPEASGSYPDIADSPAEPPAVTPARERQEVVEGLRADRREDRYTRADAPLAGDGAPDAGSDVGSDTAADADDAAPPALAARPDITPGERRRSSEVRPPEFTPPPAEAAPAATPPAARLEEAGEPPAAAAAGPRGDLDRTDLPPPPGTARASTARPVPAGTPTPGPFVPSPDEPVDDGPAPLVPAAPAPAASPMPYPSGPGMMAAPGYPAPYPSGPVVVDSRGVTTMGPAGVVTSHGPYAAAGPAGPGAAYGAAPAAGAMVAPGTRPLSSYGPFAGARSQRVAVIYFADGSSRLSGRDRQVLSQVAALQRQYGGVLRVVGHASSRTGAMDITRHKMANFTISLARANAVANALMAGGVPGQVLYVGAVSDAQPVYLEIMPTGEAGNRRAEIYLDY